MRAQMRPSVYRKDRHRRPGLGCRPVGRRPGASRVICPSPATTPARLTITSIRLRPASRSGWRNSSTSTGQRTIAMCRANDQVARAGRRGILCRKERHLHKEPRRERGFLFSLFHNQREAPSMATLTTTEHGEIHVHHRQVTRMADRLWRFGSPARRTAYIEKARRRLAAGPPRRSDAAIVLAAGEERAPS